MHAIPPATLFQGHGQASRAAAFPPTLLPVAPIAAANHALRTRDQLLVGEGPSSEVTGQRGEPPAP
jgi:hypothetical protein